MAKQSTPARWYMLNKDGMATLCIDKADAEQEAKKADATYPNCAPHRAVLMGEVGASLPLPGAQETIPIAQDEWKVRDYLAATLKCWHRMTGEEAAELVAMTQRLAGLYAAPQPAPPADSVTAECGNCFEGKSDFDHVCKKCRGSGKAADSVPAVDRQQIPIPSDEEILTAARNWGAVTQYHRGDGKGTEHRIVFNIHARAAYFARELFATRVTSDSVLEDAARLKVAVDLLKELAEHDSYSTEYDGRMVSICPECGEQEGEHRPNCAFVRAKAYLAARKQGGSHD